LCVECGEGFDDLNRVTPMRHWTLAGTPFGRNSPPVPPRTRIGPNLPAPASK
jgi:hypothetical protein